MLLAARQFFERRGAPTPSVPTARDYVQNGLIAMWDGIENAGWGVHDAAATAWKDLVGTNDLTIESGAQTITDKSVVFNDTALGGKSANEITNVVSIEFCGKITKNAGNAVFLPNFQGTGGYASGYLIFPLWFYNGSFGAGVRKSGFSVGTNRDFTAYAEYSTADTDFAMKALDGVVSTPTGAADYYSAGLSSAGFGFRTQYPFGGVVYNLRIYSRILTVAEIAANYAIDKARFNLP